MQSKSFIEVTTPVAHPVPTVRVNPCISFIEAAPSKPAAIDRTMFVDEVGKASNDKKVRKRSVSITLKKVTDIGAEDANMEGVTLIQHKLDDTMLGDVRMPTTMAAPTHIAKFLEYAYPEGILQPGRKQKCCLKPTRKLEVEETGKLAPIVGFWTVDKLHRMLRVILKQQGKVTLSAIDYFCVHYSRQKNIHYETNNNDFDFFYVKDSYDNSIYSDTREYFDVYARKNRILVEFMIDKDPIVDKSITWSIDSIKWDSKKLLGVRFVQGRRAYYMITSVGQLKHFYWSISNKVLDYCIDNQVDIYDNSQSHKQLPEHKKSNRKRSVNGQQDGGIESMDIYPTFVARKRSVTITCNSNQITMTRTDLIPPEPSSNKE